jgi:hypothetical protein
MLRAAVRGPLLVTYWGSSDTTLAHLHRMLQILFAWSTEHLHHFHIYGKDYGSNGADTRHVTLESFGLQQGERFQYVYNYYAHWQCDIRLEATGPREPKRYYPVCTGGQRPAPPEHIRDAETYLAVLDEHRYPSLDALRVLADAAQVLLEAPADVSIREAVGDLEAFPVQRRKNAKLWILSPLHRESQWCSVYGCQ